MNGKHSVCISCYLATSSCTFITWQLETQLPSHHNIYKIINILNLYSRALHGSNKVHRNRNGPSTFCPIPKRSEIIIKLKNQTRAAPRLFVPIPPRSDFLSLFTDPFRTVTRKMCPERETRPFIMIKTPCACLGLSCVDCSGALAVRCSLSASH